LLLPAENNHRANSSCFIVSPAPSSTAHLTLG
jgi:hypothetical protein